MHKGYLLLTILIILSGNLFAQREGTDRPAITGITSISAGQGTKLSITVGQKSSTAKWTWYIDKCGGAPIATGTSLLVSPAETTTYFARQEGISNCISTTVYVDNNSVQADEILGPEEVCPGEKNIKLSVLGGILGKGARWVWYEGGCNGTRIGEGSSITVTPGGPVEYFVRAEGGSNTTECRSFRIQYPTPSIKPASIVGPASVAPGKSFELRLNGGRLASGSEWVWYEGTANDKRLLGKGPVLTKMTTDKSTTYFVRAEGKCAKTDFVFKTVSVKSDSSAPTLASTKQPISFMNVDFANNSIRDANSLANVTLSIGGGEKLGWYGRIKLNISQAKSSYETDDDRLTDCQAAGYYQFNGNVINKRYGITGGLMYTVSQVSVYLGAGYGKRDLQWGITEFSYETDEEINRAWARNVPGSFSGPEVEGGIMLRIGPINLLGGIGSVNFKYIDAHAGIGINFK